MNTTKQNKGRGRPSRKITLPVGKQFTVEQIFARMTNLKHPVTKVTIHNHIKKSGAIVVGKKKVARGRPDNVFMIAFAKL